jgi:hypothetical protein
MPLVGMIRGIEYPGFASLEAATIAAAVSSASRAATSAEVVPGRLVSDSGRGAGDGATWAGVVETS